MALQLTKKAPMSGEARWVPFDKDTKVLLAGIDSPEYQVGLERSRRRLQRNDARFEEGQVGVVAGEKTEYQNHCMLLANFIVKDWSGALDEKGNPLAYSADTAAELLESSVDFFLFVLREAGRTAVELNEELSDSVGKPSLGSSGKKSGVGKQKSVAPSTGA